MKTHCIKLILAAALISGCQVPQGRQAEPLLSETLAPARKELMLDEKSNRTLVAVRKNGQVIVTLKASRDTGYEWKLSKMPDASVLQLVSQDYVPPVAAGPNPSVPLPGSNQLVFKAVGSGEVMVRLYYSGPFTQSGAPPVYYAKVKVE